MEAVPNTLEETLDLIADYGLYPWLDQIAKGEALHSTLSPEHAMLLTKLIEFSDKLT